MELANALDKYVVVDMTGGQLHGKVEICKEDFLHFEW